MGRAGGGGGHVSHSSSHSSSSFSGGGHRSGGSFSGGGSRSGSSGGGSSYSGSHMSSGHGSYGGGHMSPPPQGRPGHVPPPPPVRPVRPQTVYVDNRRYESRTSNNPKRPVNNTTVSSGSSSGGMGIIGTLVAIFIFIAVITILVSAFSSSSANVHSTKAREKLQSTDLIETEFYTDELGWITYESDLTSGMKDFYNETGVYPYIYMTDNAYGNKTPSSEEVEALAAEKYEELFDDTSHFLVVFVDSTELEDTGTDYVAAMEIGSQAGTVIDAEAQEIFADYFDAGYYNDSKSSEEFIGDAFKDAGSEMMSVYVSPAVKAFKTIGLSGIILAIIGIAYSWWQKKRKAEKEKEEYTKKILETDLETFEDKEVDNLAKKYEGTSTPAQTTKTESKTEPVASEPEDPAEALARKYGDGSITLNGEKTEV